MTKIEKVVLSTTFLLLLYLIIIPITWTCFVHNRIGVSESGSMKIRSVIPYPSINLFCYEGEWLKEDDIITMPDGHVVRFSNRNFYGQCYVSEMVIK